jgi:Ca2+-binding EF-hand superfamily protein
MFKYFDIQNRGFVNFEQFYRAMEKTGIIMDKNVRILLVI